MKSKPVPFPAYVDSSMISAYKACPMKFYLQYLRHLRPTETSVHLVAGGAYARGLEVARLSYYRDGLSSEDSLATGIIALIEHYGDYEPPEKSTKTLGNMVLALEEYFNHYGWQQDHIQPYRPNGGDPAIEFSFAIPLPVNNPDTGEPMLFTGRYDMIGQHLNALYAVDEKTTTQLGPSWSKQWDLRGQFIGYTWAGQQYEHNIAGAIVRGISILKNSFGHAEVIIHNPQHKIVAWYESMIHTLKLMIADWNELEFHQNFDQSCASYSGCPFGIVCDKQDMERWIPTNFVERVWNPMEVV